MSRKREQPVDPGTGTRVAHRILVDVGGPELNALCREAIALHHTLSALSTRLHGGGATSAGKRSVLLELDQLGPRTVPEMARARPVSRQYMQRLVDELERDGLVERVANPRHARSKRIRLRRAGRRRLRAMCALEEQLARERSLPVSSARMREAAETLRAVCDYFASDAWNAPD